MKWTESKIAFPGLGIGEFTVDRIAFTVFGKEVAWYGVIIALGMLAAIAYVMYRTKEYEGICSDDVIDFALFIIVFGVIGARLYYVITDGGYHSLKDVIAIWEGGLAIYGGIIAGAITAVAVCFIKKIRFQCFLDMLAPAVMIAQAIGRWGNFCNGEAFGEETDIFIRMQLTNKLTGMQTICVHPTFLYESLWNVIGFILLNYFYRKRKFDGQIVLGYFAWYGFGRMFIEGLRTDSLYVGTFRISQVVGLVSCVLAVAALVYFTFFGNAKRFASASFKAGAEEAAIAKANGLGMLKIEVDEVSEAVAEESTEEASDKTDDEKTDEESKEKSE